ncbi:MAG: hypothetical protein HY928_01935 [Elusimicrobia bacterium]|nr:hypothetical protein [Elusimicrobiota bacterium]
MREERGATLAEVLIAILLLAFMVSSMVGVLFSSSLGATTGDVRLRASQAVEALDGDLRNFVAADRASVERAPGAPAWHLPGDRCDGCAGGPTCWALQDRCTHDVSARLPADLRQGFGMGMSYTVEVKDHGGQPVRKARISVSWAAPR